MTYSSLTATVGTVLVWQVQPQPTPELGEVISMLKYQGCRVIVLSEIEQIVSAVTRNTPELLLIHLQDCEAEAYALCQSIKQLQPMGHLPILFLGTRESAREQIKALRCGSEGYLQLPLNLEEGWLRIERHLQTAHLFSGLKTTLSQKIGEFEQILQRQIQQQTLLARENEALQRMAFVDGLTQVANRRSFNDNIAKRWREAAINQQPMSLLLCDIDYFKRYNDTYGHIAGDDCLQQVATALVKGANRHRDQVARYGGEEFAILLPETDVRGAKQVAAAVHREVAAANIVHRGSLVKPQVSLSVGLCTRVPAAGETVCSFINRTDKALYAAKLNGRDRTVIDTDSQHLSALSSLRSYEHPRTETQTEDLGTYFRAQLADQPSLIGFEARDLEPLPETALSRAAS